jgi:hypothetical protein
MELIILYSCAFLCLVAFVLLTCHILGNPEKQITPQPQPEQVTEDPKPEEKWQLKSLADPWGDRGLVYIREVKNEWVRYGFCNSGYSDERKKLSDFKRLYIRKHQ